MLFKAIVQIITILVIKLIGLLVAWKVLSYYFNIKPLTFYYIFLIFVAYIFLTAKLTWEDK